MLNPAVQLANGRTKTGMFSDCRAWCFTVLVRESKHCNIRSIPLLMHSQAQMYGQQNSNCPDTHTIVNYIKTFVNYVWEGCWSVCQSHISLSYLCLLKTPFHKYNLRAEQEPSHSSSQPKKETAQNITLRGCIIQQHCTVLQNNEMGLRK